MARMSVSDVVPPCVSTVQARLAETITVKQQMLSGSASALAVEVARLMITALRDGGKVIFLGNGGSAQDAGHLAGELMGRFAFDRPGLAAISIPDATHYYLGQPEQLKTCIDSILDWSQRKGFMAS